MSVTALVLVLACAPSSAWTVDLDAQLLAKRSIVPSATEPHLLLGVRGGLLTRLPLDVRAGFDVGLHLEPLPRVLGTPDVSSVTWEASLTPRGVLGWHAGWGPLAIFPYVYAGPFGGFRIALLTAIADSRNGSHPTFGARAGMGVRLFVGHALLSLELGGGVRESGPELSGVFSSGLWF